MGGRRLRRRRRLYLDSKVATSYDSKWSLHQALSLLHEGDLDLDEYRGVIPADEWALFAAFAAP